MISVMVRKPSASYGKTDDLMRHVLMPTMVIMHVPHHGESIASLKKARMAGPLRSLYTPVLALSLTVTTYDGLVQVHIGEHSCQARMMRGQACQRLTHLVVLPRISLDLL